MRIGSMPPWLKKSLCYGPDIAIVKETLARFGINTVCESGLCPNLNECFSQRFVTFIILGTRCTRACGFCSIDHIAPEALDGDEPARIAQAVKQLGIKHVLITSVTRDDINDGGASQFAEVIRLTKNISCGKVIEVLVPDFNGSKPSIEYVVNSGPHIFAHNIETVARLYHTVRPAADYKRSLEVLRFAKGLSPGILTKSGMMVGLGETEGEVIDAMYDLKQNGCDILTIGQYLRPRPTNLPVKRFVTPEEFEGYKKVGDDIGFGYVAAGPFVRSSYLAENAYIEMKEDCNERCYTSTACRRR